MTDQALIAHDVPGRLRLKLPARRRDEEFFAVMRGALAQCPGVSRVESNALTGSVLVLHSGETEAVLECVTRAGLFQVTRSSPTREAGEASAPLLTQLTRHLRGLDGRLRAYSGGYVDLVTLGFVVLLVLSIHQLRQGQVLAPAATLLWYAASLALLAGSVTGTAYERLH